MKWVWLILVFTRKYYSICIEKCLKCQELCIKTGGIQTIDVVRVDILNGSTADISRLSSQSDSPQLVHPTQLETQTGTELNLAE